MRARERLIELLEQCSCAYPPPCTSECADCNKVEMYDKEIANIADHLLANGVTVQRWIPVTERLPEDGEIVLIYDGNAYQWKKNQSVAKFVKGKSKEQLKAEGYKIICSADEHGNNKKPYRWVSTNSPMSWFGQMVTHWMPLPQPPKEEA